jgi:hypothetical protein
MIKATAVLNGRETLVIGLSFGNLDRFRAEPGDTFIKIDGAQMSLPMDVILYSGETEAHCAKLLEHAIGPNTIVHTDPRLKS